MRNRPDRRRPQCFVVYLAAVSVLLAVLVVSITGWAQDTETRIALVIGNGYRGELRNPPNDAELIATTLRKFRFTLVEGQPLIDADQKVMKRAIQKLGEALDDAGPSAVGLFYYAGHGVQANGRNYLIPIGADISREADLEIEAVSADSVLAQMEYSRSRINVVILDACRNNPYQRRFRSMSRGLTQISATTRGSLIAYATAPGDVADDGAGENSPFTAALAGAIAKIPDFPIEKVFKEARIRVKAETSDRQVPWEASSLDSEFYFSDRQVPWEASSLDSEFYFKPVALQVGMAAEDMDSMVGPEIDSLQRLTSEIEQLLGSDSLSADDADRLKQLMLERVKLSMSISQIQTSAHESRKHLHQSIRN